MRRVTSSGISRNQHRNSRPVIGPPRLQLASAPVKRAGSANAPTRRSNDGAETSNYLARRHTDSAFVPVEVVGFMYRSSSGVNEVMMRFCSSPMIMAFSSIRSKAYRKMLRHGGGSGHD
jgi:hypothetical protein